MFVLVYDPDSVSQGMVEGLIVFAVLISVYAIWGKLKG